MKAPLATILVVLAVALTGCGPSSNGQPLLTEPSEIVMAGVRSTASLQFVHARLDVDMPMFAPGGAAGQLSSKTAMELDVDLTTRSLAGRVVTSGRGGADQVSDVILVGGKQFTRSAPEIRWTLFPNLGGQQPFASNDQIVAAVETAIGGSGVVLSLGDAQACGDATCYRVVADLDPMSAWQLFAPIITGVVGAEPLPPDLNLRPVTLDVLVDQRSRRLVGLATTVQVQGFAIGLRLTLTNHDVPVAIAPPPPGLVDKFDINNIGGGGGVIHGDATMAPQPVPAETP
ncbi:MAG TPA: hypothetical protein VGQ64_03725 [Candidatus Limnocylindrales bacterium]|nr:hypothetical protein [Candidatus Limnocylindrales bacterium]